LTPATLGTELTKLSQNGLDILAVHIKPAYRETIIRELKALNISKLGVMETGKKLIPGESGVCEAVGLVQINEFFNSFSACSPATSSNSTRPLGVTPSPGPFFPRESLPGFNSARNVTVIPGLAQTSTADWLFSSFSPCVLSLSQISARSANYACGNAMPPSIRQVLFLITWLRKGDQVGL